MIDTFTIREIQVTKFLIDGLKNKAIAIELKIDQRQVAFIKNNIRKKLEVDEDKNDFYLTEVILNSINALDPITKTILKNDYKFNIKP